jgi:8-oxo-dGTP pyrophosphatase MutT (NUDIX family)
MPDEMKDLLLRDYDYFAAQFQSNEALGESRLNIFIGLITVVGGGIGLLVKDAPLKDPRLPWLCAAALAVLLVVGATTFTRMIDRNAVTDRAKAQLDLVRATYRRHFGATGGFADYDLFPPRFGEAAPAFGIPPRKFAGVAQMVAVLNALLAAALVAALAAAPQWPALPEHPLAVVLVTLAVGLLAYGVQNFFADRKHAEAWDGLCDRYGRTTHAGSVVYRTVDATGAPLAAPEYLLVRAKKDDSARILPKGHIDPGDTDATAAAVREVREEGGTEAVVERCLGRVRFGSREAPELVMVYLMKAVRWGLELEKDEQQRDPQWLRYEDAIRALAFDDSRELLQRAEEERRGAAGRSG